MAKLRRVSRKPLYTILLVSLLISIVYASFTYFYAPQPTQIMEISPIALTEGEATITGILQKDSPAGQEGNYIIILSDMRAVLLDVQGLDSLLGKTVSASGILALDPPAMSVSTITQIN
jgi:hypothetical protein